MFLPPGTLEGKSEAATSTPAKAAKPANAEPLLLRDGRQLWRWSAADIPPAVTDVTRALVDEARSLGLVLVADGCDLIVVEAWLSRLTDEVRDELAANAGTIIALLRGESRVRTGD